MIPSILGAHGTPAVLQRVTRHTDGEYGALASEVVVEVPVTVHLWRKGEEEPLEPPGLVLLGEFRALVPPDVEFDLRDRLVVGGARYEVVDRATRYYEGRKFYTVMGLSLC